MKSHPERSRLGGNSAFIRSLLHLPPGTVLHDGLGLFLIDEPNGGRNYLLPNGTPYKFGDRLTDAEVRFEIDVIAKGAMLAAYAARPLDWAHAKLSREEEIEEIRDGLGTLALAERVPFKHDGHCWRVELRELRDILRPDHDLRYLESKRYEGPVDPQPPDPSEVATLKDLLRAERDAYDEIERWARGEGAAYLAALELIFEKHPSQQAAAYAHRVSRKQVRRAEPHVRTRIEEARRKIG